MNDHWTALREAGNVPPPTPETLTRAQARVTQRRPVRRALVPALASAGTAAAIAVVALQQSGGPTAAPPAPSSTPAPVTTSYPPSKPLGGGPNSANSCAYPLSPERFAKVPIAFDGTVLSATRIPRKAGLPSAWTVVLQVNEWFRPGHGQRLFTVQMGVGPGKRVQSSESRGYEIGDRLLISAYPQAGGAPFAGSCDFSRTYDVPTADTWRKVFSR